MLAPIRLPRKPGRSSQTGVVIAAWLGQFGIELAGSELDILADAYCGPGLNEGGP